MNRARSARKCGPILLVLCLPLAVSCGEKKSTKPLVDPNYRPQSSPANVLANLRQAYVDRNETAYAKLFAPEFLFYFDEWDVNNPNNPTPPSWSLTDELESMHNMFTASLIDRIELSFVQDTATPATGEMEGTSRVLMHEIFLRLDTRKPDGSPLQQVVNSGLACFYLKEYPGETAEDGAAIWRIVRWDDQGLGTLFRSRSENGSWGSIKSLYR